jgi:hypothetical protein
MNRRTVIFGFIVALCLAGCASLSTDPRLVGSYSADNSETLIFASDARVFHIQTTDAKEKSFFLGYYASRRNSLRVLGFVGPDTSPFLGTSFQVSEDFSTVTARWNNLRQPKDSWQVTYRKSARSN